VPSLTRSINVEIHWIGETDRLGEKPESPPLDIKGHRGNLKLHGFESVNVHLQALAALLS
jgi:hypothetical protein